MLGIFGNMVAEAQTGQTLGEQMGAGNMSMIKLIPGQVFFVDPKKTIAGIDGCEWRIRRRDYHRGSGPGWLL
jgi:hypothetical protein